MQHADHAEGARQINQVLDTREFLFAGAAVFTLVSKSSGTRYTFRLNQAKDGKEMFFASVLSGPSNISDYTYLGFVNLAGFRDTCRLIAGRKGRPDAPSFRALDWFLKNLKARVEANVQELHPEVELWHEGRCCRCARRLTDPASIEAGIGPECATK